MSWFDQFIDPTRGGGQGPSGNSYTQMGTKYLPPTGPPPDDSGDWEWDGSAWVRKRDPGQPTPPPGPGTGGPPGGSNPGQPTPPGGSGGGSSSGLPPVPPGWDATKWNDPNHKTPKYVVGRILAKYPPTTAGLQQAIPELQAAFPGLTFNGKDKVNVPGLGEIDVLQGASSGGVAWQWIDEANAGNGSGAVPPNPGEPGKTPYGGTPPWGGSGGGGGTGGGGGGDGDNGPEGTAPAFQSLPGFSPLPSPGQYPNYTPSAFTPMAGPGTFYYGPNGQTTPPPGTPWAPSQTGTGKPAPGQTPDWGAPVDPARAQNPGQTPDWAGGVPNASGGNVPIEGMGQTPGWAGGEGGRTTGSGAFGVGLVPTNEPGTGLPEWTGGRGQTPGWPGGAGTGTSPGKLDGAGQPPMYSVPNAQGGDRGTPGQTPGWVPDAQSGGKGTPGQTPGWAGDSGAVQAAWTPEANPAPRGGGGGFWEGSPDVPGSQPTTPPRGGGQTGNNTQGGGLNDGTPWKFDGTLNDRPDFTYDPLDSSAAFELPTGQAALDQDPGYAFRLQQGTQARESSAAARGLLRSGATLKGLDEFGQQMASQEYGNAFARARDTYAMNQGVRQSEQAQQFGQGLSAQQQNAAQDLNKYNAKLAGYNANLTGQNQGYTQAMGAATLNSDNTNKAADRALNAEQMRNAFGLQSAGFNSAQQQQAYQNAYNAQKQAYDYAMQQNLAKNAQGLGGYQIDVNKQLGNKGLDITAAQNAFMNSLNAQQQSWMQIYMMNGQSFDQAYKMMMAKLQYPSG